MSVYDWRVTAPLGKGSILSQISFRLLRLSCVYFGISLGGATIILLIKGAALRAGFTQAAFLGVWLVLGVAFAVGTLKSLSSLARRPYGMKERYRILSLRVGMFVGVSYLVVTAGVLIIRGSKDLLSPVLDLTHIAVLYAALEAFIRGISGERTMQRIREILVSLRIVQGEVTEASVKKTKEGA